jgi:Xaa-Pro dipeptidase
MSKPGVNWRDVHVKAAILFTEGLLNFGILKGNLSQLIEKEVISVFFPHGLGHLVGLRVRDTGQEENPNPKSYFGSRLRVDIQLEKGHLISVEPGLYFIKTLFDNPEIQNKFKEDICWQELEKWKRIGGVRIEDNILITETGNENLTFCVPKAMEI